MRPTEEVGNLWLTDKTDIGTNYVGSYLSNLEIYSGILK